MARKSTATKSKATKETAVSNETKSESTVDGLTFEVVDELPAPIRSGGNRRVWFDDIAERIKGDEDLYGKLVKVRHYKSVSTLRSATSGSLKNKFGNEFTFHSRSTGDGGGDLFAMYVGENGEYAPSEG